ncbi:hypothetical protein P9G78_15255 [Bacillus subtilis]|uniref:hypothetical protein n=1 Tax=Bacillus subtilis TaxID=1423 RepID=UPI002DBE6D64|nr:hypothetical protein [Bacillus subtilis]MEC2236142.1 hypothetical protein [Bacillus subtilis]
MKLGDRVHVSAVYKKCSDIGINFDRLNESMAGSEQKEITQVVYERVEKDLTGIICGKRRRAVERTWLYGYLEKPVVGGAGEGYSVIDCHFEKSQEIIDTKQESFYLVASSLNGFYLVKPEDMEASHASK